MSRPYHAKSFGKFDATTTDRLRRSPLYLDLSPSCARKRACTICRFQRLKNPHFRLFQCSRLWHVSLQTVMYQRIGNMPKACPHVMMRFLRYDAIFTKPVQNLFSTFSVIWEIIKPYKVGKYLIGFHLQLLYIRYLMTT